MFYFLLILKLYIQKKDFIWQVATGVVPEEDIVKSFPISLCETFSALQDAIKFDIRLNGFNIYPTRCIEQTSKRLTK